MPSFIDLGADAAELRILVAGASDGGPFADVNFSPRYRQNGAIVSSITTTPVIFQYVPGTRSGQLLENGHMQETFTVMAKLPEEAGKERRRLTRIFKLAKQQTSSSVLRHNVLLRYRSAYGQYGGWAHIYDGSITNVDHDTVSSDLSKDAGYFIVAIERDASFDGTTAVNINRRVNAHGGVRRLYNLPTFGTGGRIGATTVIPADGGIISRVWLGIKTSLSSTDELYDAFSPTIEVKWSSIVQSGTDKGVTRETSTGEAGFFDNEGIRIDFSDKPEWYYRFRVPLRKWNAKTIWGSRLNRREYRGRYKLLLRYKTNEIASDSNVRYGVEVGTGWSGTETVSPIKRHILPGTNGIFQYLDVGEIVIGGEGWNASAIGRLLVSEYSIFFNCALLNGDGDTDSISFDNMQLIPADSWMTFDIEKNITNDRRVEVHINSDGFARGFIIDNLASDTTYNPLDTPRIVGGEVSNINAANWNMPPTNGALLIAVTDRRDGTKWRNGWNDIYMQFVALTDGI